MNNAVQNFICGTELLCVKQENKYSDSKHTRTDVVKRSHKLLTDFVWPTISTEPTSLTLFLSIDYDYPREITTKKETEFKNK